MDTHLVTNVLAFVATIVITITLGRPLVRALAGRFERKEDQAVPPDALMRIEERLANLSHGMEAIAVAVERISEGQRFTARLLGEKKKAELTSHSS